MTLEIDQFQFTLDTALRNEKTLRYAADAAYEERFERHEAQLVGKSGRRAEAFRIDIYWLTTRPALTLLLFRSALTNPSCATPDDSETAAGESFSRPLGV